MEDRLELRSPSLELVESYRAMVREGLDAGEETYRRLFGLLGMSLENPAGIVRRLQEFERGEGLPVPSGLVPSSTWWLVSEGEVVGECRLRHRLTRGLEHEGGHIGYTIRPSRRRRGYGRRLLALTLPHARARGLRRVLVTCNTENVASARIIEANGGVLENQVVSPVTGKAVNRYWIEL